MKNFLKFILSQRTLISITVVFMVFGLINPTKSQADYSAQYFIVGGGGGGAGVTALNGAPQGFCGGGGGAGGILTGPVNIVSGGTYPVTVGGGGQGVAYNVQGYRGADSTAFGLTAYGGGGGGWMNFYNDENWYMPGGWGGSGGGGGYSWEGYAGYGPGGGFVSGQGHAGAYGHQNSAGGGGGAGGDAHFSGYNYNVSSYWGSGGYGIYNDWVSGMAYPYGTGGSTCGNYNTPNSASSNNSNGGGGWFGGGGGGAHCNYGSADSNCPNGGFNLIGGNGGQGLVYIRYPGVQRATGGNNITYYNGYTIHAFYGGGNFVDSIPTVTNVTISSSLVNPNNSTQYNIVVTGNNTVGGVNISHQYASINQQGGAPNQGVYRGFAGWYYDTAYTGWNGQKNKRLCTGGGVGAIILGYGENYINLISCSTTVSGNTRTTTFVVTFDPSFTTPTTNNDISGFVQNIWGTNTGWVNYNINFGLTFTPPIAPTITGPSSGSSNTNYIYTFNSTDPNGFQIRYGIDWSMPADGVADEWLPAGVGYVSSGVSQNATHSWPTSGSKTFRALAQNTQGSNSAWSNPYAVSITTTGSCGTANKTYPVGSTSYGSDTYCSAGTPSASPAFPASGQTVSWTCLGSDGGANSSLCSANLAPNTHRVTATRTIGGTVRSSDNFINCGTGANCYYDYTNGSNVILRAYPTSSYWKFNGWTGDCSGTGACVLNNVTAPKTVNASFSLRLFKYFER